MSSIEQKAVMSMIGEPELAFILSDFGRDAALRFATRFADRARALLTAVLAMSADRGMRGFLT